MAEKDIYIQKGGEILCGEKARKEIIKKDIEELKKKYTVITDIPEPNSDQIRCKIYPLVMGEELLVIMLINYLRMTRTQVNVVLK